MNGLLLLKDRLYLDHMLVLQPAKNVHLFQQFIALLDAHLVDLTHQDSRALVCYLFTLPEWIVLLHYDDHLLRHRVIYIITENENKSSIKRKQHLHVEN